MKCCLVLLLACIRLSAIECSGQFYSSQQVENTQLFPEGFDPDPGHHKAVITVDDLPQGGEELILEVERPSIHYFREKVRKTSFNVEKLKKFSPLFNDKNLPTLFITSRGFLPGEKVTFTVIAKKGRKGKKSNSLTFIPNPVRVEALDKALLTAELLNTELALYELKLTGFKKNENLEFISTSCHETGSNNVKFVEDPVCIHFMPAVIGKEGGTAFVKFIRENKEEMQIQLPWGSHNEFHLNGEEPPAIKEFASVEL